MSLQKKFYYHEEIYLRKFCNRLYLNNYFYDDIVMLSDVFKKTYIDKENKKNRFIELATKYIILFCSGLGAIFFWAFFSDSTPYEERPLFLNIISDVFLVSIFVIMLRYIVIDVRENRNEIFLNRLKDVEMMMSKDKDMKEINL